MHISPRRTYKWPTSTWKVAQCQKSLENCISKPQWGITRHLPEWLLIFENSNWNTEMLVRMGRNWNSCTIFFPLVLCCWECKIEQLPWKMVWQSSNIKNRVIICFSCSTSECVPADWKQGPEDTSVQPGVQQLLHNSQEEEATQVSIDEEKDK